MEGIYWLRISGVAALTLGSIYLLLPTFLQEDVEARLASSAGAVQTTGGSDPLKVELMVGSGDPIQTADALEKRLTAANLAIDGVEAGANSVTVSLEPGTPRSAVVRLAQARGSASFYAPSAISTLPATAPADAVPATGPLAEALAAQPGIDAAYWSAVLPTLAGARVPADALALPVTVGGAVPAAGGAKLEWMGSPPPADPPVAAVAIDDLVRGVAFADGRFFTLGEGGDEVVAMLASGPLPGQLAPKDVATDDPVAAEAARTSRLPAWLVGLLPTAKINLGLDLQGGIDLTLQVELDEAVLGQAGRDQTYLKEAAQKEGLVFDSVRRSHTDPVVEITTAAPLGDVQDFVKKRLPDYQYVNSERNEHRFEMTEQRQQAVKDQAVEQVLETLRKRVDATGVKEPSIVKKGDGRINVQLPGMDDVKAAVSTIGTTAVLEFRMVDDEFDDAYAEQMLQAAKAEMPPEQWEDDELLNIWLWDNGKLDEERVVLWEYLIDPATKKEVRGVPLVLVNTVVLTGNDVNDASVGFDSTSQEAQVDLEFKPRGGQIFCDITTQAVGKQFAVVLDDKVQSAPQIQERICGGSARIRMGQAEDPTAEAQTLALVLRTGALDAPVVVASVRHVGATLGADAIRGGTIAAVVGSLLVYVFMAVWYKTSGIVADIALTVNVLLVLACLALSGATLTLPGIAGLALTVGMAVDANVVVYERIREELRLGVHPRKAVDAGFQNGLVAVLDGNITTMIAGIVLFSYGTGPIRGFAVTLIIGNITTLICAVFVTRTIMDLLTRSSTARLRI